jgi:hypothetical protein
LAQQGDSKAKEGNSNCSAGGSDATGALSVGGMNFSILEQAARLLQQAFEVMKEPAEQCKQGGTEAREGKGKEVMEAQPKEQQPNQVAKFDGPESSKQAEGRGLSGKVPYCYRCKTKSHAIEECHATMFCDICTSHDHVSVRCPKFRATKLAAVPCGYAMEGLNFFHLPHEISQRKQNEARTALIRVFDENLSVHNVISELERPIPGPWKWNVEENGNNTFKTMFPSQSEL